MSEEPLLRLYRVSFVSRKHSNTDSRFAVRIMARRAEDAKNILRALVPDAIRLQVVEGPVFSATTSMAMLKGRGLEGVVLRTSHAITSLLFVNGMVFTGNAKLGEVTFNAVGGPDVNLESTVINAANFY